MGAPLPVREVRIEGEIAIIPLTQGKFAIIDAADAPLASGRNWHAKLTNSTPYAVSKLPRRSPKRGLSLHRLIMGDPPGVFVDHIDGDGLNCRRANLRLATKSENNRNRRLGKNSASGLKGVSWESGRSMWMASIRVDRKQRFLGRFDNPSDAHAAYCAAAKELHGEFARSK